MKIFIMMYNFPPIGAGRGIAWTHFAELFSRKHDVTLFTINPSKTDPMYNADKLKMISHNYSVIRSSAGTLYNKLYANKPALKRNNDTSNKSRGFETVKMIYRKSLKYILFPDRMIFWNKHLKESMESYAKKNGKPDIIISVGFPFSTHLLAKKMKKIFDSKLVLDYGDPWSFNPSNETIPAKRRKLDKYFESKVLKETDYVTVTTEATMNQYIKSFPIIKNKISVITQGVDTEIYNGHKVDYNKNKNTINFFYSGIFYKDIRNPISFIDALEKINSKELQSKKIIITIAGKMEQYVVDRIRSFRNDSISFILLGNINFNNVVKKQISSDVLLFFGNLGSVQIPGKLFEYLATDRPIFGICDSDDKTSELILQHSRGSVSSYEEQNIKANFISFIRRYNSGEFVDLKQVKIYDWKVISDRYLSIIDDLKGNEI